MKNIKPCMCVGVGVVDVKKCVYTRERFGWRNTMETRHAH